jgi:hypothetical protein
MKSVYIETTIPSYATGKTSRDMITAHRQAITRLFWENERHKYDLFVSQFVIDECRRGDNEAAQRRLNFIRNIPTAPINDYENLAELAENYFGILDISEQARADCFHLAVCVASKIDYLLSWNCTHLGMVSYIKIYEYNKQHGFCTPLLVTPDYLIKLEEETHELS